MIIIGLTGPARAGKDTAYTAISIARSYLLRRLYNRMTLRRTA